MFTLHMVYFVMTTLMCLANLTALVSPCYAGPAPISLLSGWCRARWAEPGWGRPAHQLCLSTRAQAGGWSNQLQDLFPPAVPSSLYLISVESFMLAIFWWSVWTPSDLNFPYEHVISTMHSSYLCLFAQELQFPPELTFVSSVAAFPWITLSSIYSTTLLTSSKIYSLFQWSTLGANHNPKVTLSGFPRDYGICRKMYTLCF